MASHKQTLLARVAQHQQAGELAQAEALCQRIVREDPYHAEAWNLLGVLCCQMGKTDAALAHFDRAKTAAPRSPAFRSNRGVVLHELGRFAEAETEHRDALRLDPNFADAHSNLARTLSALDRHEEAAASYRRYLELRPDSADACNGLGNALCDLGRVAESIPVFQRALALRPDYAEALNNLGTVYQELKRFEEAEVCYRRSIELRPDLPETHNNRGNVLQDLNRHAEAEACYRRALELRPSYAAALNNLGNALRVLKRFEEACDCGRRAIELWPDNADAHNNLGNARRAVSQHDAAITAYRRAVELKPDSYDAWTNLGTVLVDVGRFDEALQCFQRALAINPAFAQAEKSRAMVLLLRGDFERGWPAYEARWHVAGVQPPAYPQPLWDGSPLAGRTILLHPEQGHGDTLQFIRYATLVKQRGGTVLFHCPKPLLSLLSTCAGIDGLIPGDVAPSAADVQAPLLSLPRLFGTRLDSIPAPASYLKADSVLVERWRQRLEPGFKIGIVWQGSTIHRGDHFRSVPLSRFEPLTRIPNVRIYSLQVGFGQEQLAGQRAVTDLGREFDPSSFSDVAAVLMNLDLVITVDTALAHLAGALGVPVWVLLAYAPDWRWLLDREDSPWYPSMRLFRQTRPGDWDDVFARLTQACSGVA